MSADNSSTMMPQNNERANSFNTAANNALSNLQSSASSSTSSPLNIPYQIFSPPSAQPSSVINFSNSSEVVIGPMTQYQGPVTIYQYMDATLETRTTQAGGAITSQRSSTQTAISQKLGTTSKLLILLIVLVVIVTGIILYIELTNKLVSVVKSAPILFGNNYEHGTFPNLGNGHLVIDRTQWGANDEHPNGKLKIRLKHPTPYVLITHIGVQSVPCYTIYKCSIKMRTIQDSARAEKNLPDIQGNFYVADDGNIYVGRGWDWANTYANDTLAISFMGDYARYKPSPEQLEALQYLLAHAVVNDYITKDYKLVAQNQTRISKSPGANVFQAIKTWPHFYPCGMFGNPPCGSELGMPEVWDAKM